MILYYSGTGNSWMIANRGEWMGEIPVSMNRRIKDGCTEQVSVNERVVFVMPVYSGRPPRIVYEHIMNTEFTGCTKAYFVGELVMDALGIVNVFLRTCAERKAGSLWALIFW